MNQFKKELEAKNVERSFYKVFKNGKDGRKIYQGSIVPVGELNSYYSLATVSCFVLNEKGEILVEERTENKKIAPDMLDIVSGHIDNNETPTQAMIREYVEELHNGNKEEREKARNEAIQNLKKLEELYLLCNGKGYYIQFYAMMTKLKTITRQKEEVKNTKWILMEKLFEMIRQGKTGLVYDKRIERVFQQVRQTYQEVIKGKEENGSTYRHFRER